MLNTAFRPSRPLLALALAGVSLSAVHDAAAVEFSNESGTLTGSWDTTLSYGQAWRIESRDCRLIGTANGGCGRSPNIDDGNLNYGTDMYSRAIKAVTELSVNYRQVGAFVRASGFYDFEVMDGNTARTPISKSARDLVGSYTRLLDAFAYARFDLGSMPGELRLGRQAVSWGESTFIQNGLSVINHFDVAALRVPGSELKEGFLPQEMVNLSLQFNDRWSAQAIYITDWNSTIPEASGSMFSANDFAAVGGDKVFLGFGAYSDQGVDFRPLGGSLIRDFQAVTRAPDRRPDDDGQFGFNIKYFAPSFNNGTEFGLYFLNYHSRLPVISGRTGTAAGVANAWGAANAAQAAALGLAGGLPPAAAIAAAAQAGLNASRNNALGFAGDISLAQLTEYARIAAGTLLAGGGSAGVGAQATALATHEYAKTARYFVEYPEDIQMIGLSFNTQLQTGGIALQGELTYRKDVPLQYDDVELLFAAMTPFEAGIGLLNAMAPAGTPLGAFTPPPCTLATNTLNACNQLGRFGVDQDVRGWGLHDTWQAQFTATKTFANVLKAAQAVLVLEAAVSHVADLPSKISGGPNGRGLRYNGPGTSVSGNPEFAARHFGEVEPLDRFADSTSWGYRLAGRLDYPGLMGPWNVLPRFSWQHDVSGTSPGPGGSFVEGRYGLTLGVSANLRARWEVDLAWTTFGGAGRFNDINDRDFIATSVKFSF
ncbi:MAG: DUF1302 domain-containing protein [Sinobacteraceae bacterium]|nr:DUF1302 domain-containing protein [Nevskiaceae bacterium]MCP5466122.1 DUF1302 domain-containing protein [Nevskiaceae bacterium]MCP5471524.1 DUF1302 domain-containing protein [Nevskiaceae bacterium]